MEVKQVFGLECGRSALTGVGFILLEGLDALKENGNHYTQFCKSRMESVFTFV